MEEKRLKSDPTTRPRKLRGKDDMAVKGFIFHSIVERLSAIVRVVPGCEDIAKELQDGSFTIKAIKDTLGPPWERFIADEIEASASRHCLEVSWFFLENYIYRYILGLVGYFDPSSKGYLIDPWHKSKMESLEAALPSFLQVMHENPTPSLEHLVLCCLWGNRSDLSLSSGAVDASVASGKSSGTLLANDFDAMERHLLSHKGKQIVMVLDNCGAELLSDLRLAAHLASEFNCKVVLHVKAHPVFVSDALVINVEEHIQRLEKERSELASTLRTLMTSKQLSIVSDPFYCSPLDFPQAPETLKRAYSESCLVVLKGDANYRRMIQDRGFPVDHSFASLCSETTSTPVFAIRTCKSPVAVGLNRAVVAKIEAVDPKWCVNGTCGTLQFSHA